MVSSSDDSDSGGKSRILPTEKGNTVSLSSATAKYKRRGVSVVRDFPPGCGRNAVKDKPRKVCRRNVSVTRDFPPFCGRNAAPLPQEEKMRVAALQKNKNLHDEEYVEEDQGVLRNKINETLHFARLVSRKLLYEGSASIDNQMAEILRAKGKYININKKIRGDVPGVQIGDVFQYHELNIVGLHSQPQSSIDCVKEGDTILATSIIAFGGYENDLHRPDTLFYRAEGENVMYSDKMAEDQKFDEINLALANNKATWTAIRVIWAVERSSSDSRGQRYIYDGLYTVRGCEQEVGIDGKLIYIFNLVRCDGQPRLPPKLPKKTRKLRNGICVYDMSQGREVIPISAYNKINDDLPPQFHYVNEMVYPDWYALVPSKGCDCPHSCSDFRKCSCVMKNAGMPYNEYGALLTIKPLVYECGPTCKCPPSCYNRVSQHGIRYQLEIFMTEKNGWGARSLNSIASGSFICEYLGELLNHEEADQRIECFDYLYDIGSASGSSQVEDEVGYTIDAAQIGNVGRFINHSCSPNLVAQNVLFNHDDRRCPHIMFFAAVDIPRMQELSFDYNCGIDNVFDAHGNVKKKPCDCGSSDCKGRMY
ncbi:hypothetical protein SLE2022_090350 [Rubroshorea leprosula]